MPNFFQLSKKTSAEFIPVAFQDIDVELCELLKIPVDKVKYCYGWYDAIGFRIATGKTMGEIKAEFIEYANEDKGEGYYEIMLKIIAYLDENYTSSAWARIGK